MNRLSRVKVSTDGGVNWDSITEYKYDPEGNRVAKTVDGVTTKYLIDAYNHTGYAQVLEQWASGGTTPQITYTIGDDVITEKPDGGPIRKHLLRDGHGSVRQVMLHNQTILEAYSYDGYGNMLGGNPQTPAATNLLYAGEWWDTQSQHYYNRARWYNPLNGLFNQMDSFAGSPQDPQSLHKYLYCHANPVNAMDPGGRFPYTYTSLLTSVSLGAKLWIELAIIAIAIFVSTRAILKYGVVPGAHAPTQTQQQAIDSARNVIRDKLVNKVFVLSNTSKEVIKITEQAADFNNYEVTHTGPYLAQKAIPPFERILLNNNPNEYMADWFALTPQEGSAVIIHEQYHMSNWGLGKREEPAAYELEALVHTHLGLSRNTAFWKDVIESNLLYYGVPIPPIGARGYED